MQKDTIIALENQYSAGNYAPLPVVLTRGKGVYLWDEHGKQYLDMMSAYSAVSHGHCHPRISKVLCEQVQTLGVISRAYYSDKLGKFLKRVCELSGMDKAIPMNTGAEAVETALKAARKWAYTVKGVPADQAEIIVCEGNFHGRTSTIVGFSSEQQYRAGFGPFAPGYKHVRYGDAEALRRAITPNTAAFLVEPIQGEAGIIVPPAGYLKACEKICRENNVLLICDEVQTGLGRTGKFLAIQHEDVKPDGITLGKAVGGGFYPVSLFLASKEVMSVFKPGDHGSTFGGNPIAAAVGLESLNVLIEEKMVENSAVLGDYLISELKKIHSPLIKDVRGKGLFIGIEVDSTKCRARDICLRLIELGLLSKDTHETVIRLAPPLVITKEEVDKAVAILKQVFPAEALHSQMEIKSSI